MNAYTYEVEVKTHHDGSVTKHVGNTSETLRIPEHGILIFSRHEELPELKTVSRTLEATQEGQEPQVFHTLSSVWSRVGAVFVRVSRTECNLFEPITPRPPTELERQAGRLEALVRGLPYGDEILDSLWCSLLRNHLRQALRLPSCKTCIHFDFAAGQAACREVTHPDTLAGDRNMYRDLIEIPYRDRRGLSISNVGLCLRHDRLAPSTFRGCDSWEMRR